MTVFALLIITAFIGGVITIFKCGSKEGICNYGQVGEDNVDR